MGKGHPTTLIRCTAILTLIITFLHFFNSTNSDAVKRLQKLLLKNFCHLQIVFWNFFLLGQDSKTAQTQTWSSTYLVRNVGDKVTIDPWVVEHWQANGTNVHFTAGFTTFSTGSCTALSTVYMDTTSILPAFFDLCLRIFYFLNRQQ